MPPRVVPVSELEQELEKWHARLRRAAEAWVQERAAGRSTTLADKQMREAEHHTRRLERRIRRRKKKE
jgi:hypothetical protein